MNPINDQYVVFAINDKYFAISIQDVFEITRMRTRNGFPIQKTSFWVSFILEKKSYRLLACIECFWKRKMN